MTTFEQRIQSHKDALNPYAKGSPNYYFYERERARDILREYELSGVQADADTIANPRTYDTMYKEYAREADKRGQKYGAPIVETQGKAV